MGNDFSHTLVTQLQAHKLVQYEMNENRAVAGSTTALNLPTGLIGNALITNSGDIATKIHSAIFFAWRQDHVNAIAAAAALSSVIIAISNNGRMLLSVDVGTWVLPLHARTPRTPLLGLTP